MFEPDQSLPPLLPVEPPPPASPLLARMLNVFAMPGVVFEEVRVSRPAIGNWLLPAFIAGLAVALSALVISASPAFSKQLAEQQARFQAAQTNAVAGAKLSPAEVEQNRRAIEMIAQPVVLRSFAVVGGFAFGSLRTFWWAFVLWLIGRFLLRRPIPYGKALEVAGLSSLIAALGSVVMVALMVNLGESFQPSGFSLVVADLGVDQSQWLTVAALNITNFWLVTVLGLGLARLAQVPWFRAAFLVFTYWLLAEVLMLLVGGVAV